MTSGSDGHECKDCGSRFCTCNEIYTTRTTNFHCLCYHFTSKCHYAFQNGPLQQCTWVDQYKLCASDADVKDQTVMVDLDTPLPQNQTATTDYYRANSSATLIKSHSMVESRRWLQQWICCSLVRKNYCVSV